MGPWRESCRTGRRIPSRAVIVGVRRPPARDRDPAGNVIETVWIWISLGKLQSRCVVVLDATSDIGIIGTYADYIPRHAPSQRRHFWMVAVPITHLVGGPGGIEAVPAQTRSVRDPRPLPGMPNGLQER
jgi:hypothetical protein